MKLYLPVTLTAKREGASNLRMVVRIFSLRSCNMYGAGHVLVVNISVVWTTRVFVVNKMKY